MSEQEQPRLSELFGLAGGTYGKDRMSYLSDDERKAIETGMLSGPPVTIAKASATHWPKEDMLIGGFLYHYSRASDEFVRHDVLEWVNERRQKQKEAAE